MTSNTRNITFMPGGRSRCRSLCGLLAAGLGAVLGGPQVSRAGHQKVEITADNAYMIGFGNINGITIGPTAPVENCTHQEIFDCRGNGPPLGPETYHFHFPNPAAHPEYFYIVAWSDELVTQGVIGHVLGWGATGDTVTGDPAWQVCPTGDDADITCPTQANPPTAPSLADINAKIALCNAVPVVNGHWVGAGTLGGDELVFGENNVDPGPQNDNFRQVCPSEIGGTKPCMRWMWNNAGRGSPNNISSNFTDSRNVFNTNPGGSAGGGHNEFLIFRIKGSDATLLCAPAPAVSAWGVGALALLLLTGTAIKFGRRRAATA